VKVLRGPTHLAARELTGPCWGGAAGRAGRCGGAPDAARGGARADEIDAIGTKRYESQSGGEREIQRTMLELLNQMDGFDSMGDVKARRARARLPCLRLAWS